MEAPSRYLMSYNFFGCLKWGKRKEQKNDQEFSQKFEQNFWTELPQVLKQFSNKFVTAKG